LKNHLFLVHKISTEKAAAVTHCDNLLKNWCSHGGSQKADSGVVGSSASNLTATSNTKYDLNRDIALWFSTDLLPFSFVEKQGFVTFLEKNFGVTPPSASIMTHGPLIDMYKAYNKVYVRKLDNSVRSVSCLTDI